MKITYLSDADADYKLLEDHLAMGHFGVLPDLAAYEMTMDEQEVSGLLGQVLEQLPLDQLGIEPKDVEALLSSAVVLPTRFESPTVYRLLDMLVHRIKDVGEKAGIDVSTFPHYASIANGATNARATRFKGFEKKFLLFDSQMFIFCQLFAKAFAQCLPLTGSGALMRYDLSGEAVTKHLHQHPEYIGKFLDVMASMHGTDEPSRAEQYVSEAHYLGLAELLCTSMELFIVAHEFGHVYAGHLNGLVTQQSRQMMANDPHVGNHLKEFEADVIGMILMVRAQVQEGVDPALSYIGAELFFHAREMQDRFDYFRKHRTDAGYDSLPSESHPAHALRRAVLRKSMSVIMRDPKEIKILTTLAENYEGVAKIVWTEIKEALQRATNPKPADGNA